MPDLESQLKRYAEAAAQTVPAAEPGHRPPQHRRPRRRGLAAAAVAAAVLLGAVVIVERFEPSVQTADDRDAPADLTTTTGPATRGLRLSPVVASTGAEYLVWSGEAGANDTSQRADGFAVDLGTGDVRPIPVAPIDPRSGATGAWTGTELIVCCGTGTADGYRGDTRSAAAWDPTTDEWRELARPPASIARSFPTSVWTGQQLVVVAAGPAAATYDPRADRWTEIEPPPIGGRQPESAWTGREMIVWDAINSGDRGWTWAPGDDAWSPLPELPAGSRTSLGSIAWTGDELVVWGQSSENEALGVGAVWRPGTDQWRAVAAPPFDPVPDVGEGTPHSQGLAATSDGRVLVRPLDGQGDTLHLYDPASDTWQTTTLTVVGFHPLHSVIDGTVLIPDEHAPVVGRIGG